jgi:hypothetical protein
MLFSDFHLLYLTLAVLLISFVDLPEKDRHILAPQRAISVLLKQHNDVTQPCSGYGRHQICVLLAQILMRTELFERCHEVSRLVAKSIFTAAEQLLIEPQQLNGERGFSEAFKSAVMTAAIRLHGSAPQANAPLTACRAFHSELRCPKGGIYVRRPEHVRP